MKQCCMIICLMLAKIAVAQFNSGPQITALGNAGVAIKNEWAIFKNQAGLNEFKNLRASVGYENKYFLKEFSVKSITIVLPVKKYVIGLGFQNFGINAYKESKSTLAIVRNFGPKFSSSISFQYHQLQISNYGNSQGFTFELGSQFKASDHLIIGAHISNPNSSNFDKITEQTLPSHLQFGLSYLLSDKVQLSSEFEHLLHKGSDIKLGLAYEFINDFTLRGGLSQNPFQQYFGFGLSKENLLLDLAISKHPILGYSPQISVGYEF